MVEDSKNKGFVIRKNVNEDGKSTVNEDKNDNKNRNDNKITEERHKMTKIEIKIQERRK